MTSFFGAIKTPPIPTSKSCISHLLSFQLHLYTLPVPSAFFILSDIYISNIIMDRNNSRRQVAAVKQSLFDQVLTHFLSFLLSAPECVQISVSKSKYTFIMSSLFNLKSCKMIRTKFSEILNTFPLQGHLDEQFIQLEELQDDANPNFVEEIVTLYYRDSSRLVSSLEHTL